LLLFSVSLSVFVSFLFFRNPGVKESSLAVSTKIAATAPGTDNNSPFSPGLKSFKVTGGGHFDDLEDHHEEESLATLLENHDHDNEWKKEYLLLEGFKKRSFRKMKVCLFVVIL
jgi:hypothetical protein